jgi:SAM-dependent methyltransferase
MNEIAEQNMAHAPKELQDISEYDLRLYREYDKLIKPGQVVVVVGPSSTIFNDATLLLASQILGGKGKLFVADPVSSKDSTPYDQLRAKLGVVSGIGNINQHIGEIESLIEKGIPATPPVWLGKESAAQNIPLEQESVDVLIDHNTSVFLANSSQQESTTNVLKNCYREYYRVLKKGGHVILQTDAGKYSLGKRLFKKGAIEQSLREIGFSVTHQKIEDKIFIPVGDNFVNSIPKASGSKPLVFLKDRVVICNKKHYLKFDKQDHRSNDVYIATK